MNFLQKLFAKFKTQPIEIEGEWIGSYGFSSQYPLIMRDKSVRFVATIHRDSLRLTGNVTSFKGTIAEDETGIPEIAPIDGFLKGRRILFNKTYQKSYSVDELGTRISNDQGPQHIIYGGAYMQNTRIFTGQWRIETTCVLADGRKITSLSTGHWEMKKRNG